MKNTTASVKFAPRFVDDNHVLVPKEFAKNARIFGSSEYKIWKEIRLDCPDAEMVTKNIKKNPNKKVDTKNMTYENMAQFIRMQNEAEALMAEFKKQVSLSKVQTNPYRFVLAWFLNKFSGYDAYKAYFEKIAKKAAAEKDIFALAKSSADSSTENEDIDEDAFEDNYALAANM